MKNYIEKLIEKIRLRFRCLIGFHRFYVWEGKSDLRDKFNAVVWYERRCAVCSRVERKDFR